MRYLVFVCVGAAIFFAGYLTARPQIVYYQRPPMPPPLNIPELQGMTVRKYPKRMINQMAPTVVGMLIEDDHNDYYVSTGTAKGAWARFEQMF